MGRGLRGFILDGIHSDMKIYECELIGKANV